MHGIGECNMQKAFKDIVERLEELHKNYRNKYLFGKGNLRVLDGCQRGLEDAIEIVNQIAEEYEHVTTCYLQSPCEYQHEDIRVDDSIGWIPCSERLPDKEGTYLVTLKSFKTITFADFKDVKHNPHFNANKVIAWQPLPQPYVKGK